MENLKQSGRQRKGVYTRPHQEAVAKRSAGLFDPVPRERVERGVDRASQQADQLEQQPPTHFQTVCERR